MKTLSRRNLNLQNYVDSAAKSKRYFKQAANVTSTLMKRLRVICDGDVV